MTYGQKKTSKLPVRMINKSNEFSDLYNQNDKQYNLIEEETSVTENNGKNNNVEQQKYNSDNN